MKQSITTMIPAYNEEEHIKETVLEASEVLKNLFKDYEIILINDNSTDKTGEIFAELEKTIPNVRLITNKKNLGLGHNYKIAVQLAKKDYFTWLAGDNQTYKGSFENILRNIGKADIIVGFTANSSVRSLYRRVISRAYTHLLNFLFSLNLQYYNAGAIYKTDFLKKMKMGTSSFAFQAEILIRALKMGHSYVEVPMYVRGKDKKSSLFRFNNAVGILKTIVLLLFEVHIKGIKSRQIIKGEKSI